MRFIAKLTALSATIACAVVAGLAQEKLRRVEQPPLYQYKNMPVAVVVKLDDREMVDRKAMARADWLHRLSLDVINTSGKDIKALSIRLILRDGQTSKGLSSVALSVLPGNSQSKTAMLLAGDLTSLKPVASHIDRYLGLLKEHGTVEIEKVILDVHDVEFTDGTRWLIGDLLRFDPESGHYKKVQSVGQNRVFRGGLVAS